MPSGTTQPHHGKIRTWTLPTILGLVIGVVGSVGVVELRPQIAVVPQCAPLKNGQPFSIPFRISNTGYFGFEVVTVHCYFHKMSGMATNQPLKVNVTQGTLHDKTWDNQHLDRGEGKTLTCEIQQLPPIVPTEADMTVVVDYKATWYPTSRGYFRFIGAPGDNWQWLAQPSQGIQRDVDKAVDDAIEQRIKNKQ